MNEHECIIGLLRGLEDTDETTFNELKTHIRERKEYERWRAGALNCDARSVWELKDYCDKRKSTDLKRFEFCPYCGKKIDWKKIKEENKDEEV